MQQPWDDGKPGLIEELIEQLCTLPSIGRKSAQRLAYFLLHRETEKVEALAETIVKARRGIRPCSRCFNYTEAELCSICSNVQRNTGLICVVEKPEDVYLMEKFGEYRGLYHVLGGNLSPLDGVGPESLNMMPLRKRAEAMGEGEVILALGTNPDGEATMLYIQKMLQGLPVHCTRLARGIPLGSELQYVDEVTMRKALEHRVHL